MVDELSQWQPFNDFNSQPYDYASPPQEVVNSQPTDYGSPLKEFYPQPYDFSSPSHEIINPQLADITKSEFNSQPDDGSKPSSQEEFNSQPSEEHIDSGIHSANTSEIQQSNAEIAQSMGLLPIDMSFAFANSCILCAYGIPHPTVEDIPKLQDGTWYNNMDPNNFNTILSFLQP